MKTYVYYPKGVCSKKYEIDLEDGIVKDLRIEAGCDGNLKGLARLIVGQPASKVAGLLRGVRCDNKSTSCPDQISKALAEAVEDLYERRQAGA